MKAATFEQYSPAYKSLVQHLRTISHLNHASSVLNYDRQVFMPQSDMSSFSRGQQLATLASITHEKSIDPQIGQWISQAMQDLVSLQMNQQQQQGGDSENSSCDASASAVDIGEKEIMTVQRLLELEKQSYQKQICIPSELAARKAELEASANHAWVKVRTYTTSLALVCHHLIYVVLFRNYNKYSLNNCTPLIMLH